MVCLFVGDLHCGSTCALAPAKKIAGQQQAWLYAQWQTTLTRTRALAKREGIILMLGGDLIDGPQHHAHYQTWGNHREQRDGAVELLMPFVNLAEATYSIAGTDAHVGDDGEDDRTVAQELGARDLGHRARVEVGGRILDWAHHGLSVGRLPWTAANGMLSACRVAALSPQPPALIVSHHAHRSPTPVTLGGVSAAICPCWQANTSYGFQVAPRLSVDIGALLWRPETMEIERWVYGVKEKIVRLGNNSRHAAG